MDSIIESISAFITFMNSGIYDFITSIFSAFVTWFTIASIKAKIFFIGIAWGVAENLLANFELSEHINHAWSDLDSTFLSYLTFFRIPEAINIILQAAITRYVLGFF